MKVVYKLPRHFLVANSRPGLIIGRWNPLGTTQKPFPTRKVFLSVPNGHSRKPNVLCERTSWFEVLFSSLGRRITETVFISTQGTKRIGALCAHNFSRLNRQCRHARLLDLCWKRVLEIQ